MRPIRVCAIRGEPELLIRIKDAQKKDQSIQKSVGMVKSGHQSEYKVSVDDILYVNNRLVVPNVSDLKQQILKEAHCNRYSIHPGGRKMYNDLKNHYWWKRMKSDVTEYISPFRGTIRFGKRGKLSSHFIGPYEILDKIGNLAYRLELPPALSGIHDVFHVSMLRKHQPDLSHIIQIDEAELDDTLSYFEKPIHIFDRKENQLRNKTITLVKVQWSRHGTEEATWETDDDMRQRFPNLFQ
ncbi:uncharacterized protein [Henckelia pumila]|uniref:uncharacterized protein n=1 Tax=Henckelia pumila TaxID=405737 RepID=UPI003C6DD0E1